MTDDPPKVQLRAIKVRLYTPSTNDSVPLSFPADGTAVAGVATVTWLFTYTDANNMVRTVGGTSAVAWPGGTWAANVVVGRPGSNGTFEAWYEDKSDGGSATNIVVTGVALPGGGGGGGGAALKVAADDFFTPVGNFPGYLAGGEQYYISVLNVHNPAVTPNPNLYHHIYGRVTGLTVSFPRINCPLAGRYIHRIIFIDVGGRIVYATTTSYNRP